MNNLEITNNTIKMDAFEYTFDYEIDEVKLVNEVLLVLLKIPKGSKEVDNLYGLDSTGKLLWRVQSVQEAYDIPQNTPYIKLIIADDGKVEVTNFYGMRYSVDPIEGKLIGKESIRW